MSIENTTEARRDTLKIIGAIGTTCAFPFSANELYGQQDHQHPAATAPAAGAPYTPKTLTAAEYAMVSIVADLIIPQTDTPGAVAAGVPQYIDETVGRNNGLLKPLRDGIALLDAAKFGTLSQEKQIAMLTPWSNACDQGAVKTTGDRFFRTIKNLTADGYYTSYEGLVKELGYQGGQALASFPSCESPGK